MTIQPPALSCFQPSIRTEGLLREPAHVAQRSGFARLGTRGTGFALA